MAKRNPFDQRPPQPKERQLPVFRPDADLRNADWPKRTHDVDEKGNTITPKIDVGNNR